MPQIRVSNTPGASWAWIGPGSATGQGGSGGSTLSGSPIGYAANVDRYVPRTFRQSEILDAIRDAGSVRGAAVNLKISRGTIYEMLERLKKAA